MIAWPIHIQFGNFSGDLSPTNSVESDIEFLCLHLDIHLETLLILSSSSPKISINTNSYGNVTIRKELCLKPWNHSNGVDTDLHNISATLDPSPSSSCTSPFVDSFNFEGMEFNEAISAFLHGFKLPGEAQNFYCIIEKFAERYCKCKQKVFTSADTVYVLA